MATRNIPQQHIPQVNRRRLGGLAALAAAGLVLAGTVFTANQLSNDAADTTAPPSLVVPKPALPSVVSPTVQVVVGSAAEASVLERFLADTGVSGMHVRVVDSETTWEALEREMAFRRAAGEDVTVSDRR